MTEIARVPFLFGLTLQNIRATELKLSRNCITKSTFFSAIDPDYEKLQRHLQSNEASSGDSFYVRVNMTSPAGPSGSLSVFCNDILHVTNTRPAGLEDSWYASQVHPSQLLDLQSGTVPNYYRCYRGITDHKSVVVFCFFGGKGFHFPVLNPITVTTWEPHRAQRLLIRAIEEMSFQTKKCEKVKKN